jgi:hypothetical protein
MSELVILLTLLAIVGLWFENRTVSELATARCRQACEAAGVQFLDDIAPMWRIRFRRDARGHLRPQRVFTFDYSTGAGDRRRGTIVMLGHRPELVSLEQVILH